MEKRANMTILPHNSHDGYVPVHEPRHRGGWKIEKHVYLRRDQILYDVDAETSLVMRARRDANTHVDNNRIGTDEADNYRPLLNRYVNRHVDDVRSALSAYLAEPSHTASMNGIDEWEETDIHLHMPDYWMEDMYPNLVGAIQRYVTAATVYDYLSLVLSPTDPVTTGKREEKDEAMADIKKYANTPKPGRVRKRMQPF